MPIHQGGFMPSGNGSSFEATPKPKSGSLEGGSMLDGPADDRYVSQSDYDRQSRSKIFHQHLAPKGERYVEQIPSNDTGLRDSYSAPRALARQTHHGLEQQGDRHTGMANASAGPDGALAQGPRHVPDPSCGIQCPDSMKRRAAHG
jgi:hypothetical protein